MFSGHLHPLCINPMTSLIIIVNPKILEAAGMPFGPSMVATILSSIGLMETGIVRLGIEGTPVRAGDFGDPTVLLAVLGFLLIGILAVTTIAFVLRITPLPEKWLSLPPDPGPIFLKLDIFGALTWGLVSVILIIFVMAFLDTLGTLIALAFRANLLDEHGNLPEIEKPVMSFTYNIGIGMTAGFVVYPLFKTLSGRLKEVKPGLWVLAILSLLFFVFYPY